MGRGGRQNLNRRGRAPYRAYQKQEKQAADELTKAFGQTPDYTGLQAGQGYE